MRIFESRKKKPAPKIPIGPRTAISFVLLTHQGKSFSEISKKLKSLIQSGYDIRGLRFRSDIDLPGYKSDELNSFLGVLGLAGYRNMGDPLSLTEKGVSLLEEKVMEAFAENPQLTQRFAKDVGLDLNIILQKYVQDYLALKEQLLRQKYEIVSAKFRA